MNIKMFPAGYTNFSYYHRSNGLASPRTAEIACGTGDLELLLEEGLHRRGLELPDGNLTIDRENREIEIRRDLTLSENSPSVHYSRSYPLYGGLGQMMEIVDRMLEDCHLDRVGSSLQLSRVFERYLINNSAFSESVVLSKDRCSKVGVQGTVRFTRREFGAAEEHAEYSICSNAPFLGEISKAYRNNTGNNLSIRRQNILARKDKPLKIDTFLRVIDINPASSKYGSRKVYRNLRKCSSFLANVTFEDYI